MVGSNALVSALTRCALLDCVCDLKASQMNVKRILIREHMIFELELGYNATETVKEIFVVRKAKEQLITLQ